ncbi:MAG: GxxExxY protein [Acidobacteriota bacterium]
MEMKEEDLTATIIRCAFKVHNSLGSGFAEKVYENALMIELVNHGLEVKQQEPIKVFYDGKVVGDYFADLLVESRVIIELKAVQSLSAQHETQLVNYLVATGIDTGLLINFGASVQVKRKYRRCKPKKKIL